VLEKQLKLRMEKIESLTEINSRLQAKVAALSCQAASQAEDDAFENRPVRGALQGHDGMRGGLTQQERAMLQKLTNQNEQGMQSRMGNDDFERPSQNHPDRLQGKDTQGSWARNIFGAF